MISQIEYYLFSVRRRFFVCVLLSPRLSAYLLMRSDEDRFQCCSVPNSGFKPTKKQYGYLSIIFAITILMVVSSQHAKYHTSYHARMMGIIRRDVLIQVDWLLVCFCCDQAVLISIVRSGFFNGKLRPTNFTRSFTQLVFIVALLTKAQAIATFESTS